MSPLPELPASVTEDTFLTPEEKRKKERDKLLEQLKPKVGPSTTPTAPAVPDVQRDFDRSRRVMEFTPLAKRLRGIPLERPEEKEELDEVLSKPMTGAGRTFEVEPTSMDTFKRMSEELQQKRQQAMTPRAPGYWAPEEQPAVKSIAQAFLGKTFTQSPSTTFKEFLMAPADTMEETIKDIVHTRFLLSPGMGAFKAALTAESVDLGHDVMNWSEDTPLDAAMLGFGTLFLPGVAKNAARFAYRGATLPIKAAGLPLRAVQKPLSYLDEKLKPVTHFAWNNVLVKAANARVIPTWEKAPAGAGTFQGMKKSLADIMQPAIERMTPNLQKTFRNTQAMKANVTRVGENLSKGLRTLTGASRFEVIRALRGTPLSELRTQDAKNLMSLYETQIKEIGLKPQYEIAFREQMGKLLNKNIDHPENMFVGDSTFNFLDDLGKAILEGEGKLTPETIQKGIEKAIENPLVSKEMKAMLMDVYNLPASTPEMVAEASKVASTAFLSDKLKNGYKGIVRAYLPKGAREGDYLKSKWSPFVSNKGRDALYVKRDVELELRALQEIPKISHGIVSRYFMSPWKMMKVMARPAANVRNDIGNVMLNHVGGLPFWRMDIYEDALMGMMGKDERLFKLWKDYSRTTGAGGTFSVNEVNFLYEGTKYNASAIDAAFSRFERMTSGIKTMYAAQESMFKFAKYLHNLEKGMGHTEAVWDAMKWTFNYGEITRFTGRMRTYVAPFYTWQSKIIPLMAEAAVKHPVQFTAMISFYNMMQNKMIGAAGVTEEEWANLAPKFPEYIKKGMFLVMPWRDEQDRLNLLNMTYMLPGFGDMNEITSGSMRFFLSNPILTITAALYNNRRFSGAPIYYDWEDPTVRFAKQAAYVWEQLMPAIVPGGTDWRTLHESFSDVPTALSGPAAVASTLGFKLTPLHEQEITKKADALKKIHLSELTSMVNRELRKARNDEERQRIMDKFQRYRQRIETDEY